MCYYCPLVSEAKSIYVGKILFQEQKFFLNWYEDKRSVVFNRFCLSKCHQYNCSTLYPVTKDIDICSKKTSAKLYGLLVWDVECKPLSNLYYSSLPLYFDMRVCLPFHKFSLYLMYSYFSFRFLFKTAPNHLPNLWLVRSISRSDGCEKNRTHSWLKQFA